jgi:hypothetical protein
MQVAAVMAATFSARCDARLHSAWDRQAFARHVAELLGDTVTVTSAQFVSNLVAQGTFLDVHGTVYRCCIPPTLLTQPGHRYQRALAPS